MRPRAFLRAGLSLVEVLVVLTILGVIFGITMASWSQGVKGAEKGHDALHSLDDASKLLRVLRRDLRQLAPVQGPDGSTLRVLEIRGSTRFENDLRLDLNEREFHNLHQKSEHPLEGFREDRQEWTFYQFRDLDGSLKKVRYTYLSEEKTMRRQVGASPPEDFALPRLEGFRLQLFFTSQGSDQARALFGSRTPRTGRLQRFWFQLDFLVRAEDRPGGPRRTQIELGTRIFPVSANQWLWSRSPWSASGAGGGPPQTW